MESLKISTGSISLNIQDDDGNSRGVFRFNPTDVRAAQRVFAWQKELAVKEVEYDRAIEQCESDDEKINLLVEIVDYFEDSIDELFGKGASQTLFGDDKSIVMFDDFFSGILPYYEKASADRMAKYQKKSPTRKSKK